MKPTEILVAYADDHVAVRKGIIANMEADGTIKVIIEGKDGAEFLENILASKQLPDVCIIDINMPNVNGFSLLKEIKTRWPEIGCLILTVFETESYILEMIKHGANGYLLKSCDPDDINAAVHTIYAEGYYYSQVAGNNKFDSVHDQKTPDLYFSEKEEMLLRYVCTELSYTEIAKIMNTTFKGVDGTRTRLFAKLNVNSRISLALASIKLGYFTMLASHVKRDL